MQSMNQISKATGRSPFQQLLILEERVKLSGSTLPKMIDTRVQWAGVRCRMADTNFVLRLQDIAELLDNPRITAIPRCEDWVKGAVNLRGRILPVYGVAEFFHLPTDHAGFFHLPMEHHVGGNRVVVVDKGPIFCGLLVERVFGMQKFYQEHFTDFVTAQGPAISAMSTFVSHVTSVDGHDWHLLNLVQLAKTLYESNPGRGARKR